MFLYAVSATQPLTPQPLTDDARAATLVAALRGLTDLAVELAHIVGAKAKEQLEDPPEPPARGAKRPPDYSALFIRYANLARALVAAELRLAANTAPTSAAAPTRRQAIMAGRTADPRRDKIMALIDKAIKNSPDRGPLRRGCADYLEELLAEEGSKLLALGEILFRIHKRYGLPWDVTKLPDEFLVTPTPKAA